MVKAKLAALSAALLVICSCGPRIVWEKHLIDGHMTGVTAVAGAEWESSLGTLDSVYHAPNGTDFHCGSTPVVAKTIIDVQPRMAYLKEILAYCPEGMTKYQPESPLSNWTVDAIMFGVESITHKHVDVGISNFGGIRVDIPKGDVLLGDVVSMYPFKNYLCHLTVTGADLRYMFDQMARRHQVQCVGGARFVIRDGKACNITVGGKPLDDDAVYGVATVDFLLDGGDSVYVARNARSLTITDVRVSDFMVPYVRTIGASGEPLEYSTDGRIVIE